MELHVNMSDDTGAEIKFEGSGEDLAFSVLQILNVVLKYEDFQIATELIGQASNFSKADFEELKQGLEHYENEEVPTWKEQGIDVVFPHWRGVMGPKDMTPEQIAYWDETMQDIVKSDRWQKIRKNNDWENYYKDSEESEKFLKEQRKKYKALVKDSGMK